MRPETKKLIEEKKATWPDSQLGDLEIIWLSDLQEIIECETKPLQEEIEKIEGILALRNEFVKHLRDEFAMRAPKKIPAWFFGLYAISDDENELTTEEVYFKWRFYYADQMMKEREL